MFSSKVRDTNRRASAVAVWATEALLESAVAVWAAEALLESAVAVWATEALLESRGKKIDGARHFATHPVRTLAPCLSKPT